MRIAVVCPSVHTGDAVGNDTRAIYHALKSHGHEARIFVHEGEAKDADLDHLDHLPGFLTDPSHVLLLQFAHGWDAWLRLLESARCRKVVRYHNVTPAHFFFDHCMEYAFFCYQGREQIRDLVGVKCDLYLCDSQVNRSDLLEAGLPHDAATAVVPPFHHVDALLAAKADPAVLSAYDDGAVNWLSVGRLAPNKGHALLIDAFARYHHGLNRHSRLLLVGSHDPKLTTYIDGLKRRAEARGVAGAVVFAGKVPETSLKAYYQAADAVVTASEHEGFCVPLVEAMALGVPNVAYGTTAVPETLGDAGLLWDEPDPDLLAESVHALAEDESLGAALARRGRERYRGRFANDRVAEQFLAALKMVA